MSRLKLSDNLFLGSKELNFLTNTLSTDGFKRLFPDNVFTYGVVIDSTTPNSLRVIQDPNNVNMVLVQDGALINGSLDYGTYTQNALGFSVPANGTLYITATIQESNQEPGTVTVDADGNVTGVGTSFTETIRGLPNFASKVFFPDASLNVSEYTVREVVSDTLLRLNVPTGSLGVESIAQPMEVVGTFTPGVVIPNQDKRPFVRSRVVVSSTTTEPTVGANLFRLASVTLVGGSAVIVDERSLNTYSVSGSAFSPLDVAYNTPDSATVFINRSDADRYIRVGATESRTIGSIEGDTDGSVIVIQNAPSSNENITLAHNSSPNSFHPFNFVGGANLVIEPGNSVMLVLNSQDDQWQLLNQSDPLRPLSSNWTSLGHTGWSVDAPIPQTVDTTSSLQGVRYKIIGNVVTMSVDIEIAGNGNGVLILRLAAPSELLLNNFSPLTTLPIGTLTARSTVSATTFTPLPCFMTSTQMLVGMNIQGTIPDGLRQVTGTLQFELTR